MIEEQHVSEYGSLLDPNATWLENLLLHEYNECYLYYSFYQDELDPHVKGIWEKHLYQEITHLHKAAELLAKYENKQWQQFIPGPFPKLLQFHDTRDYVRKILGEQIELTLDKENVKNVHDLPAKHPFFMYQDKVNHDVNTVASHLVIDRHQKMKGIDYRSEVDSHPVEALRNRKADNTTIGRTQSLEPSRV